MLCSYFWENINNSDFGYIHSKIKKGSFNSVEVEICYQCKYTEYVFLLIIRIYCFLHIYLLYGRNISLAVIIIVEWIK